MSGLAGRRVVGEGAEAVIYDWDDGLVLRLMRSGDAGASVARATMASEAARTSGVRTPRVLEVVEVEGRAGQIMERIQGPDMFSEIGDKPHRMVSAARNLARIQTELHRVEAPAELEPMHRYLIRRLTTSSTLPEDVRGEALTALGDLPEGTAICHGDLHPGNIVLTRDGPVLIDWSCATRGDATADFARTRLLIEVGTLPPGASTLIRALVGTGRKLLLHLYVSAYRKAMPVDTKLVERWRSIHAAVRLTEIEPSTPEGQAVLQIARRQLTR